MAAVAGRAISRGRGGESPTDAVVERQSISVNVLLKELDGSRIVGAVGWLMNSVAELPASQERGVPVVVAW